MTRILPNRIVELILIAINILCPILAILPAIDISLVILGLNNEYPVLRNNNMVDLRTTIRRRKDDVIDDPVIILRQTPQDSGNILLTNLPFELIDPAEEKRKNNSYNNAYDKFLYR